MSGERFQRSPNYPWKRERDPTKHRPFLSQKESTHRVFQNGSTRSRFMGCHDRIFKENEIKTGGLKENTMFTLIKGGILYSPEKMGVKDILIVGRTITKISDRIDLPSDFRPQGISVSGKLVTPGFIDLHVPLLGGGGF